jgi:hypothetical protein
MSAADAFRKVAGVDPLTLQGRAQAEALANVRAAEPATSATKAVVIGEGMPDIKTVVKQLQTEGTDAKWYQAWHKNFPDDRPMTSAEFSAAKARNQRWIDSKIKQEYDIYDIGIDPLRTSRSPFYEVEQSIVDKYGYPTIDIRGRRPK